MLTFKDILQEYIPVEEGDFFIKFQIKEMIFILYQDKADGNVKCIEMMTFSCISIQRLSLLLGVSVEKRGKEYKFDISSTREAVLAYIFDVSILDESDNSYERYVGKGRGYILYNLQGQIRNFFEISENGCFLRFQNQRCLAQWGCQNSEEVILCFNPVAFEKLIKDIEFDQKMIILLASDDVVLFEYIFSLNKKIFIYVDNNMWETLSFLIFHKNKTSGNIFSLVKNKCEIILSLEENQDFDSDFVMNLVDNADRYLKEKNSEVSPYVTDSSVENDVFFIIFFNSDLFMEPILKIFNEMVCNEVELK